jgi:hypothetical protein
LYRSLIFKLIRLFRHSLAFSGEIPVDSRFGFDSALSFSVFPKLFAEATPNYWQRLLHADL